MGKSESGRTQRFWGSGGNSSPPPVGSHPGHRRGDRRGAGLFALATQAVPKHGGPPVPDGPARCAADRRAPTAARERPDGGVGDRHRSSLRENVRSLAAAQLGLPYTTDNLKSHLNIAPQGKSNLVNIQATAGTPKDAARIANTVATSYIRIANDQTVKQITAAQTRLRNQFNSRRLTSAQRTGLRAALTKLSVLPGMGPGNVHFVQSAVPPTSPSSPKPVRNAVIGGLVGLIIGLALAFGVEQFDGRLRRVEDVERETGLPLLAAVPRSRWLRRPLAARKEPYATDTDPFRRLASHLRHISNDGAIRSVLVTSSARGAARRPWPCTSRRRPPPGWEAGCSCLRLICGARLWAGC